MDEELREKIPEIIEQYLIAYGCKECGGGGTDDNNEVCARCKGLGIVDFKTEYITNKIMALIASYGREARINELENIEPLTHEGRGTILWEMDAISSEIKDRLKNLKKGK